MLTNDKYLDYHVVGIFIGASSYMFDTAGGTDSLENVTAASNTILVDQQMAYSTMGISYLHTHKKSRITSKATRCFESSPSNLTGDYSEMNIHTDKW